MRIFCLFYFRNKVVVVKCERDNSNKHKSERAEKCLITKNGLHL